MIVKLFLQHDKFVSLRLFMRAPPELPPPATKQTQSTNQTLVFCCLQESGLKLNQQLNATTWD